MPEAISDNHERLVKRMIYIGLNLYCIKYYLILLVKGQDSIGLYQHFIKIKTNFFSQLDICLK